MNSLKFPDMFTNVSTKTISGREATLSNLKLILKSDKGSLFGDPYFGSNLKKLIFNQNNTILRDIVIDDIYTTIITFIPQVILERKDVKIELKKQTVYVTIKLTNLLDFTTDMFTIQLTNDGE